MPHVPATLEPPNWFGSTGLRALAEREQQLRSRARRGRVNEADRQELREIEHARRELHALGRARAWADRQRELSPLELVKRQASELALDGLSLRCLNVDDLTRIHELWPEWSPGHDIDRDTTPVSQPTPDQGAPE